jgi:hypothetical protein
MDTNKLKLKIGEHEFEAEGPTEVVQAQFAAFREMVMGLLTRAPEPPPTSQPDSTPAVVVPKNSELLLDRIMKQDGRIVSLTARANSIDDEILLVLLGQRNLRNNEAVTGGEIIDGLKRTGHAVNRIDYKLDKMSEGEAAMVITIGSGRARRYRMTSQGFAKAQDLAMGLVSKVA